jgi:hypothetical protein
MNSFFAVVAAMTSKSKTAAALCKGRDRPLQSGSPEMNRANPARRQELTTV